MKQIDLNGGGIMVTHILKDQLIKEKLLNPDVGDIFIKKAFMMADGRVKVVGFQYADVDEFRFAHTVNYPA